MENYSYSSYPDSGNSSPRSREIEYENPPWDDQQQQNYKAKFMCSYGGKIHPRPHDNQLSYIGGETKIFAVERNVKFSTMIAKLASLCGEPDVTFKYQLPGEELDALISVTNDDDLDHMMHEYERLFRSPGKPARMRLFIFPASPNTSTGSFGPGHPIGSERDRFVEALNSVPAPEPPKPASGNVDYLFGLEKGVSPPPPPPPAVVPDPVGRAAVAREPHVGLGRDDRVFGSDQGVSPAEIQRQLQELQRMQIGGHGQEAMYRRKSEEAAAMGGFSGGPEYYVQKMPEKSNPVTMPSSVPVSAPAGYWPDKQIPGGAFPGAMTGPPSGHPEQPVYVIPGHSGLYHAPQMGRPITGQPSHGYYAVQQRVGPDTYRDQPMFSVAPPQPTQQPQLSMGAPATMPPQQQLQKVAAAGSTEGILTGRPGSGVAEHHVTYAQVGYDGATGRQVFYTAAGGVVAAPPPPQYQGMAAATADMRTAGQVMGQDGKVIAKVSQASSV
ncbi:hypothetical protein CDL15_Pgr008226 [Punica granatum]|uniref:PB1 domain-containing protein n=1 Tax=Punica granatum TaxID=22663 RepID=A0A218VTM4_PUNGR|nr:hypothetical protein CDL15_Pgr008226 [Punica granatum]